MKHSTFFLVFVLLAAGCSLTHRSKCEEWKENGQIYSTIDSCVQCMDSLGSGSLDIVKGCALGLDAATLMHDE
jgi:hypothetical protein